MIRFVEECRREWSRLGVPDAVADEMAEDLAADLDEARAEGAGPEDVLGASATDPRSFAASWAAARGVTRATPESLRARGKSPLAPALALLFAAIVAAGAVVVIVAAGSGSRPAPQATNTADQKRPVRTSVITTGSSSVLGAHEEGSDASLAPGDTKSSNAPAPPATKGLSGRAYEQRSLALPDVISTG
jgi:hypothetical protein